MKINLNIQTQIHLLKHFYFLDNEYIDNSGDIDNISSYLKINSSKFFKSFATNPIDLINKIEEKLFKQSLQEGKNEISLLFNDVIGFDLLINNNLKNKDYTTTRKLNIILFKENENLNIITIFPGEFAPALPDIETQSQENYNISKEFWDNHHLSNFNNFKHIENKILDFINDIDKSWNLR